ncbi:helix-turn-helix domain-containing protein [Streptomyces xiamenensis]|uniref:helix-turn-helix domain-containing protein n=1 Tax=Streptomyces xiamenensis TaxID=408015 RepID=UPI0035E3712C
MTPPVVWMLLGEDLRRLRVGRGLTQVQAALHLGCHLSKISRIEQGQHRVTQRDVEVLLDHYRASPRDRAEADILLTAPDLEDGHYWDGSPLAGLRMAALTADATTVQAWNACYFPGPLQTPAYARALLDAGPLDLDPDQADQVADTRRSKRHPGQRLTVYLAESVLHRPWGGHRVMAEQLEHLRATGRSRRVTVRVIPASRAFVASDLTVLTMPASRPDLMCQDQMSHAGYYTAPQQLHRAQLVMAGASDAALDESTSARLIRDACARYGDFPRPRSTSGRRNFS